MKKLFNDRVVAVLVGIMIVSLTMVIGCVLALRSEAASGSPITFTIAENPYTAEIFGEDCAFFCDWLSIHFERKSGTQWYQWYEAENQTFSISYSSQSDSVFKIHNWIGYTYYLEFVNNVTGSVDYVLTCKGETYNVGIDSYVYASDLPGNSYTVVPSMQAKYFPHSPDVSGSLTFVALFPDGRYASLSGELTDFISLYPSDAKICSAVECDSIFRMVDGATIDPKYYDNYAYWVITDSSDRTIYIDYIVPDARYITVKYHSVDGQYANEYKNIQISESKGTIDIPSIRGYSVVPERYDYPSGSDPIILDVYLYAKVDTSAILEEGYNQGYSAGYSSGSVAGYSIGFSKGVDSGKQQASQTYDQAYQDGYQEGYSVGLNQNALTGAQISEIRKDYNVITGFFDGMWNWMRDFFTMVTEGVGFGGITLGDVIWTLVIIVFVLWIGGKVL